MIKHCRHQFVKVACRSQRILLQLSYTASSVLCRRTKVRRHWVVGPDECANMVYGVGDGLCDSITVSLSEHPFYKHHYDYSLQPKKLTGRLYSIFRGLYGPLLLGYLSVFAKGFVYIGPGGFLQSGTDGRAYEFSFLKHRGIHVICIFVGSEIRSPQLMEEQSRILRRDVVTTYQVYCRPKSSDVNDPEALQKNLAAAADRYADEIVNATIDQVSHLHRKANPFMYFLSEDTFQRNDTKFNSLSFVRILHAPSSPIIKGTPLVRAAIKQLNEEGYKFEYTEITGANHEKVLFALREAHIALNEFYAFMPGQFGVEAMASHVALLTSADERIEHSLPRGANKAWMVTEYWRIYDNLKLLLDEKLLIKKYADSGFEWAWNHCRSSINAERLVRTLS
jgi:hypothetical protein